MSDPVIITYDASPMHDRLLYTLGVKRIIKVKTFEEVKRRYGEATHVLLQGGGDIHPKYYKDEMSAAVRLAQDEKRDKIEYALAFSAMLHHKRLLGICRGHQMVAVAAGAKLMHDLPLDSMHHARGSHQVKTVRGSAMRDLYGFKPTVNSYHHQAVLAAPKDFKVTAVSPEGLIEAMESEGVLTVQWHPELMRDEPAIRLYERFLYGI